MHRVLLTDDRKGYDSKKKRNSMSASKKIEARREYQLGHLDESMRSRKPMEVLSEWLELAKEHDPEDYNAMCLSTVTERRGELSHRSVERNRRELLKIFHEL